MAKGKMRVDWDRTDLLACIEYRKRGVEMTPGHFNPLRTKARAAVGMAMLNHETCPEMYYQG